MRDPFQALKQAMVAMQRKLARQPDFGWAQVTGLSPLRIKPEFAANPLNGAVSTVTAGLLVGDRVFYVMYRHRTVVLGKAGG